MSYDVEEKVVKMQFDNSDFQPNIDASIRSLGELEKALKYADGTTTNFSGTEKSFKNLDSTIGNTLISVEKLSQGFTAMGVAAVTVISDITRKIEGMGLNTLNSLFVTPIRAGFAKYGDQISSTQVIMNNTGETIDKVKESLGVLNEYANKTIYNFSQMTYAVGKFAAAGVNLNDATKAIQGLSNAAAMVGANNAQLYSAYYNLSQSMQMGYLKLIDWKSIANSMIGTKQMRKEFVKSAIELGKFTENSEQAQEAFNSFEDSLHKKWLTTDVIVHTMQKYQDATSDVGKAAIAAASELKSFSQMWDVISQTTQSSWAKTWEIIIGDLGGAKTVWTNIGNRISAIMNAINKARNDFLSDWNKDGRSTKEILEGICNVLNNIRIVLEPIYNVLTSVLNITADKLYSVAKFFNELTKSFELSEEAMDGFRMTLIQIAKPIAFIVKAVGVLLHVIGTFISLIGIAGNIIFMFLSNIDKMPDVLTAIFGPDFADKISNINKLVWNLSRIFGSLLGIVVRVVLGILPAMAPLLEAIGSLLLNILSIVGEVLEIIADSDLEWLDNLMASLVIVIRAIATVLATIPNLLKTIFGGESGAALKTLLNDASQLLVILAKLLATGLTIGAKILTTIAPFLEKIGQLALSVANIVLGFLNGILNFDSTGFSTIFDGITNFILVLLSGFDKVVDMINSGLSAIINSMSRMSKFTKDLGSSISTSVNANVNVSAEISRESLDKVTEKIQNNIISGLSIGDEVTAVVSDSIEQGAINAIPNITKSTKIITKTISNNVSDIDSNKVGKDIISKVSKGITKESPKIKADSITKTIGDRISADDLAARLDASLNNVIISLDNFKDKVNSIMDEIGTTMSQAPSGTINNGYPPLLMWPIYIFDRIWSTIEVNPNIIKTIGIWSSAALMTIAAIVGVIVAIVKLSSIVDVGSHLEKAADNISNITNFKFVHSFTKTDVKNGAMTAKTIKTYGKMILAISAGLAVIIVAIGAVLKLAENYNLNDPGDQAKFWAIIGTVNLIVAGMIATMFGLANIAKKTSKVAETTAIDFKNAGFSIKNAFSSIKNGIGSFSGALVSLPQKLTRTKNVDQLVSLSKLITSIAVAFGAVMAGITALLAITKIYNADELRTRLMAIGVLLVIISSTIVATTAIVASHAAKLNGRVHQADNIAALGNAIKGIITSLGAVSFALKFLFNDKKSFSMPKEYLIMVGMLYATIIALTSIIIANTDKLAKNYDVMDKVYQDERFKHLSRGISLIILSMSSVVLALSQLRGIDNLSPNLVKIARNLFKTIIGLTLILVLNVNKLEKMFSSGSGKDKKIFGDNRIIKLAASISGIIYSMSFLMLSLRSLKDIGEVNDNTLSVFTVACISVIALSLMMVLSIDNVFKKSSSTVDATKERANRILKLAGSIAIVCAGVSAIVISLRSLNGMTVNERVTGLVATTLGIATGMSAALVTVTKLFKAVHFTEFMKTAFALAGCIISIGSLVNYIKLLNDVTIDKSTISMMIALSFIVGVMMAFITKINGNKNQFTEAIESIGALMAITGSLLLVATAIKSLSGIDISLTTLGALLTAGGMIAALAPLMKFLGKMDPKVLGIGAAAITVLTASIAGLSGALNILSNSDMQNLDDGLKNITNAIDEQGFKKMAEFIGFMWMLGFSLMIAAPGIAIAGLSIAGAIRLVADAFPGIISGLQSLKVLLLESMNIIDEFRAKSNDYINGLSSSQDRINRLSESISSLGNAFVTLGAGMFITGAAMWFINKRVFSFVAMCVALAIAIDIASVGIWLISKNIEGLETVLDNLEKHMLSIVSTITAIGQNGKGGMYLGIGFAALGFGIMEAAKAVKIFGQGILWVVAGVAAAIVAFKLLDDWLGGKLTESINKVGDAIKNLFSGKLFTDARTLFNIGSLFTVIIIAAIAAAWAIKKFGQSLIWLGVGLAAVTGGMSLFIKSIQGLDQLNGGVILGNLALISMGIAYFSLILSLASPLLLTVIPLLPELAGGLAMMGVALRMFNDNDSYYLLGVQLLTLAAGLIALSAASAVAYFCSLQIVSVINGLTWAAKESNKWITLSVNIRTIFDNIGNGIFSFAEAVHSGLTAIGNGISNLALYILTSIINLSSGISAVGSGIQGFFTNIGLGILSIAQSVGRSISSIGNGIYGLAVGIGDGIFYIASSITSSSQMIVVAATNIATAIDNVTTSIVNAKSSLTGGFSFGNIFGISSNKKSSRMSSNFEEIGAWISKSLAFGITKAEPVAEAASLELATNTEETFRNSQGIHSLSELWAEIGAWISKSLGVGIERDADGTIKSLEILEGGIADSIDDWTGGALRKSINKAGNTIGGLLSMIDNIKENGISGLLGDIDLKNILGIDPESFADMFKGLADQLKIDGDAVGNFANSMGDVGSAAGSTKGTIESLTDTLKDQMNIFERFTADEDIMNPKELINNMKSQLRGMQNWANGIDMLAMRGMSGPLLQYLAEMGPEGYKYVEAFLEMTGEEFEQANELYTQSLEMPESVAKQIGNSYERVGVEIIESTKSASGAITGATDDAADHINDKTTETVNKLSSAVINGVKITKDELTKLMLEYDKDQEMIYFKSTDALGNITEHIMSTHEFGAWRASNYAAKVIDETHFNMSKLFSASALGNIKVDNATLQQAAEEYSGKEMLYYVDSVKKFYNREQYADFRKSCQDKNVEVLSITADQLKDIELNYEEAVEDTSKTTQNAITSTTDDVANTVGEVGEVAGTSVTDSFTNKVESWLDTKLPGLGTTWRDKIAEEFKMDPDAITGSTKAAIDSYMSHNMGEEIKAAGMGMIMVDKLSSAISRMGQKRAKEIIIDIGNGLRVGADDYLGMCEDAGKIIGGTIYNGTAKELGIASPSKEYAEIARFSVLGFVQGITKNISLAENASENLGDATLDSLSETIGAISSTFTEDMDTTPTIRPVLDLSNVYDGMTALDTTFSTSQARIAGRAYMTTYDDSVDRLEDAYKKAIMDGNVELANMLLNSDNTNVIVNVHLDTNAEGIFDIVKVENEKATRDSGVSPLMIARNGAIRASLA